MKKIFFVDDEYLVLAWLEDTIDWNALDLEVAGHAENGKEALEKIQEIQPDIVVTDIRMPLMDGIELIKNINSICKVVILSGYSEFSYAQQALQLGAVDYILKPMDNEKVIEVIRNVSEIIDKERRDSLEKAELKRQVEDSLPVLKEKFLYELVLGINPENSRTMEMTNLWFGCRDDFFEVLLVDIDNYDDLTQNYSELNKLALGQEVKDICNRILVNHRFDNEYAILNKGELICILAYREEFSGIWNDDMPVYLLAKEIRSQINEHLKLNVSIGISRRYQSLNLIGKCYHEAQNALKYRLVKGGNSIIHIQEGVSGQEMLQYPIDYEKRLISAIGNCDQDMAFQRLAELFQFVIDNHINSVAFVRRLGIELTTVISRLIYEIGGTIEAALGQKFNPLVEMGNLETMEGFQSYLRNVIRRIIDYLNEKRAFKTSHIISKALEFINDHIDGDISVEEVASLGGISNNYFSLLFKQETGVNFVEYVTSQRIKMAKNLLRNKELKIYDIGAKVGYQDPKYFSQVFKKETGMSPNDFRKTL